MTWKDLEKHFYDEGLFTKADVYDAVEVNYITPQDYKDITGDEYIPNQRPTTY